MQLVCLVCGRVIPITLQQLVNMEHLMRRLQIEWDGEIRCLATPECKEPNILGTPMRFVDIPAELENDMNSARKLGSEGRA